MIFKLNFSDGSRVDYCTAKDQLHLFKSYDAEYDIPLEEFESIEEISEESAKEIFVRNPDLEESFNAEPEQFCLFDLVVGNAFEIIASTSFYFDDRNMYLQNKT